VPDALLFAGLARIAFAMQKYKFCQGGKHVHSAGCKHGVFACIEASCISLSLTHTHTRAHTYTHTYKHTHVHAHSHIIHTHTRTHAHTHTKNTCTHARTHAHKTHTHTCTHILRKVDTGPLLCFVSTHTHMHTHSFCAKWTWGLCFALYRCTQ